MSNNEEAWFDREPMLAQVVDLPAWVGDALGAKTGDLRSTRYDRGTVYSLTQDGPSTKVTVAVGGGMLTGPSMAVVDLRELQVARLKAMVPDPIAAMSAFFAERMPLLTPAGQVGKLNAEVQEFWEAWDAYDDAPDNERAERLAEAAEEAADVIVVLTAWASTLGVDLSLEVRAKMDKNRRRTWDYNGDGSYSHRKPQAFEQVDPLLDVVAECSASEPAENPNYPGIFAAIAPEPQT